MPASRHSDEVLLDKIAEVFRLHGFDGASISLLSAATGLERASLYHRFPGGKEQMAEAIVTRTAAWFEQNVFATLRSAAPPAAKLRRVARNLQDFYRGGTLWCVLDSMTLGGGPDALRQGVRGAYAAWLSAFTGAAREAGLMPAQARSRAEQALLEIEGSLVIARVLNDARPFRKVLAALPHRLTSLNEGTLK